MISRGTSTVTTWLLKVWNEGRQIDEDRYRAWFDRIGRLSAMSCQDVGVGDLYRCCYTASWDQDYVRFHSSAEALYQSIMRGCQA